MSNEPLQYSRLDRVELADRFIKVSEKFLEVVKTTTPKLRFSATKATDYETSYACGTIACHGGFGLVIFPDHEDELEFRSFTDGADRIAHYLGFEGMFAFTWWARTYPEYWGNNRGEDMFTAMGSEAFGLTRKNKTGHRITLLNVAHWYANVAARLLGQEPTPIGYGGNNV